MLQTLSNIMSRATNSTEISKNKHFIPKIKFNNYRVLSEYKLRALIKKKRDKQIKK